jgi:glycosyltransferase involved in cell wall biosynthesis
MPFYNARKTVAEAVSSILGQTFTDFEFIVIDDGSTDHGSSVVEHAAAGDPRVVVVRHDRNLGAVERLNEGLAIARGAFVARIDADDRSHPQRFERQLAFLQSHTDVLAVSAALNVVDKSGREVRVYAPDPDARHDAAAIPALEPYLPHTLLMARASALARVGGYRHVLLAEDADLYWRLIEVGALRNLPEVLGAYRLHDDSVSSKSALNGRVQAVFSQLAALSARRRALGQPDIAFPFAKCQGAVENGGSFAALLDYAKREYGLSEDERRYLLAASVPKYLRHSEHRPYSLEPVDAALAFDALALARQMTSDPRKRRRLRRLGRTAFGTLLAEGAYGAVAQALVRQPRYALVKPWRIDWRGRGRD